MAGKKISELDQVQELTGQELLPFAADTQNGSFKTQIIIDIINSAIEQAIQDYDESVPKIDIESELEKISFDIINVVHHGIVEGLDADPEENKIAFQNILDTYGDDKKIYFPHGSFVINPGIDLGEKRNITIIGYSSNFASFAQKNINTGQITDTFTKVICGKNTYENFFNHKSCILVLDKIGFYNCLITDGVINTGKEAKTNTLMQHTRSEDAKKNVEKGKVFCTDCGFFGWKVAFGSDFTMQHLEDEWATGRVAEEYEYYKQSCVIASRCRFTRNGIGVNQPVDGRLIDCSFNKNDYAIVLRENSGFSTISGCRIEWNIHNGIYCEKAHEVTVVDCEFDCNGKAGLYAIENTMSNFSNNIFRRNGAYVKSLEDESHKNNYIENVHIFADKNINCNFIGNNTLCKAISDVGSAPERPTNCTCFSNNQYCIVSLNNLHGCTKGNKENANAFVDNIDCFTDNNII